MVRQGTEKRHATGNPAQVVKESLLARLSHTRQDARFDMREGDNDPEAGILFEQAANVRWGVITTALCEAGILRRSDQGSDNFFLAEEAPRDRLDFPDMSGIHAVIGGAVRAARAEYLATIDIDTPDGWRALVEYALARLCDTEMADPKYRQIAARQEWDADYYTPEARAALTDRLIEEGRWSMESLTSFRCSSRTLIGAVPVFMREHPVFNALFEEAEREGRLEPPNPEPVLPEL